jgi:hypothetical protein
MPYDSILWTWWGFDFDGDGGSKHHPTQVQEKYCELGRNAHARRLQSYFTVGKYVILDLGFCLLKGLTEFKKDWLVLVPGDVINHTIC